MQFDPWDVLARPLLWFVLGVLWVKQAIRLNWEKRWSKPVPGTGRWTR